MVNWTKVIGTGIAICVLLLIANLTYFHAGPTWLGGVEKFPVLNNGVRSDLPFDEIPSGFTKAENGTFIKAVVESVPPTSDANDQGGNKDSGLGDKKDEVVTDANTFPSNLDKLPEYLKNLPKASESDFNKAWDGGSLQTDATEARVLRSGDSEGLAKLVKEYGLEAVWQKVQDASTSDQIPTIFKWEKVGKSSKLTTAEQKSNDQFGLELKYNKINSDGELTSDVKASSLTDGGKQYGGDWKFD